MRTKHCLTSDDAKKMVEACKAEAAQNNWKVSIAVVDEGGFLLHLERHDGANPASAEIAIGKARTSAFSRNPSKMAEDTVKDRPAMVTLIPGRTMVQGGLPVMYQGECVGGIGVSGVKSHEDEQVAAAGVKLLA